MLLFGYHEWVLRTTARDGCAHICVWTPGHHRERLIAIPSGVRSSSHSRRRVTAHVLANTTTTSMSTTRRVRPTTEGQPTRGDHSMSLTNVTPTSLTNHSRASPDTASRAKCVRSWATPEPTAIIHPILGRSSCRRGATHSGGVARLPQRCPRRRSRPTAAPHISRPRERNVRRSQRLQRRPRRCHRRENNGREKALRDSQNRPTSRGFLTRE